MIKAVCCCFIFFSFIQTGLSQCTNPEPIGPKTQSFCKTEFKTVQDLIPSGRNIVWYGDETGGVAYNNSAALTSRVYYAENTSEGGCSSSRLSVEVFINGNPPNTFVSIKDCAIDVPEISDLFAFGTNIEWFLTETGGNSLAENFQLQDQVTYWAQQIENGCTSSRSSTRVTLLDPAPPSVSQSTQIFCKIGNPTVSNLDVQLNDSNSTAIWYASEISNNALDATTSLVNGTVYWVSELEGDLSCESTSRASVFVIINTTPSPTTSSINQTFCDNISPSTVASLKMSGTAIKWYETPVSVLNINASDVLVTGTYYATQTDPSTGCESAERTLVNVVVNATPAPIANTSEQTFCKLSEAFVSNLEISGTGIKWYSTLTANDPLALSEQLIDGEDYYATQTDALTGCESVNRTKLTVALKVVLSPITNSNFQTFCASSAPSLVDLEVNGTNIKYYETLISTIPLEQMIALEDGEDYFISQTNALGCESESRLEITVSLIKVDRPILLLNSQSFCILKGRFILSDLNDRLLESQGNEIVWYDDYPNGSILSLSETLEHKKKYYAVAEDTNACKSIGVLEVEVDLEACEDEDLIIYDGFSPNGDGINDVFTLKNIELLYPNYSVDFYNRWGNIVYRGNANKPYWNGELNGNKKLLSKGIYFYILNFSKNNKKPKQGNLYLSR